MKEYNKNYIPLARNLRKNMTPWERKLWYQFLRNFPVKFRRQQPIGNYIADFYCASAKLVIELDGNQHFEQQGISTDFQRDKFINSFGIVVLRISNLEIQRNFHNVCYYIENEGKKRSSPSDS